MRDWKQALHTLVGRADALTDRARARLSRLASWGGPFIVIPYLGYGSARRLLVCGRVLRDEGFRAPRETDPGWRNLVEFYKRLESDEVPGARVRVRGAGTEREVTADGEGYFSAELEPVHPLESGGWITVDLELLEPRTRSGAAVRAQTQVLVPPASAKFGVISDIDDTVVQTNVIDRLEMLLTVALTNARTRKPFKGVAAFYRALGEGATGVESNPIFYVSNSPWNLYPPLVEFLGVQEIPLGPLLLRDFGDHMLFSQGQHHGHKARSIERILDDYAHLEFVLIGDSGELDPEIYTEIVGKYPERIRVIYIRSVNPDPSRIQAIDRLVAKVQQTGAQLVLTPDSEFAAVHAAGEGLIRADALARVRSDKREDEQAGEPAVRPE